MEISRKGAGIRVAGNFNWKLFTRWGTRFDWALRVELEPKAGFGDAFEFWMIILSFQYPFEFELVELSIKCKCFIRRVHSIRARLFEERNIRLSKC